MSLFERSRRGLGDSPNQLIPQRQTTRAGAVFVTPTSALYSPAVWASLRLRAEAVASLDLIVYRMVDGRQATVQTPPILVNPGGEQVGLNEWLYSSQFELDRVGNAFGIISELDGNGKPARIDLVDSATVRIPPPSHGNPNAPLVYNIGGKPYTQDQVWHERAYTLPGMVMGLSPISAAAYALGQYQSATEFALEWFANGASIPGGVMKNTSKTVDPDKAATIKKRFKQAVQGRDVLVVGNDWEYTTVKVAANESQFLETQQYTERQAAQFIGVPGDLIDVAPTGKTSITYANITQRNLQFLIMNLGPALKRREAALSRLLSAPRNVRFDTTGLLRMDPDTRASMFATQILSKQRTPSEVRELDNYQPFTPEQIQEFDDLGIVPAAPITPTAQQVREGALDV